MIFWLPSPTPGKKDGGWDPAIVSMLLNNLNSDDLNILLIKDLSIKDLKKFLKRFRLAIASLALPQDSK